MTHMWTITKLVLYTIKVTFKSNNQVFKVQTVIASTGP